MKNNLPSKEYWEKREAYKLKQGLKDINKIEKELAKVYKEAMNEMVKEINNLFYKYATDNNLSYKEANRLLFFPSILYWLNYSSFIAPILF